MSVEFRLIREFMTNPVTPSGGTEIRPPEAQKSLGQSPMQKIFCATRLIGAPQPPALQPHRVSGVNTSLPAPPTTPIQLAISPPLLIAKKPDENIPGATWLTPIGSGSSEAMFAVQSDEQEETKRTACVPHKSPGASINSLGR